MEEQERGRGEGGGRGGTSAAQQRRRLLNNPPVWLAGGGSGWQTGLLLLPERMLMLKNRKEGREGRGLTPREGEMGGRRAGSTRWRERGWGRMRVV